MAKLATPVATFGATFQSNGLTTINFESFTFNNISGTIRFKLADNNTIARWDVLQFGYLKDETGDVIVAPFDYFVVTAVEESLAGTFITAKKIAHSKVPYSSSITVDTTTTQYLKTRKDAGDKIPTHGVAFMSTVGEGEKYRRGHVIVGWDPVANASNYRNRIENNQGTIIATAETTSNYVELDIDTSQILTTADSHYWKGSARADGYDESALASYPIALLENYEYTRRKFETPTVTWRSAKLSDWGHGYSLAWEDDIAVIEGRVDQVWAPGDLFTVGGYTTIFRLESIADESIRAAIDTAGSLKTKKSLDVAFDIIPYAIKNGVRGVQVRWSPYLTPGSNTSTSANLASNYVIVIERNNIETVVEFTTGNTKNHQLDPIARDFIFEQPGDYVVKVKAIGSSSIVMSSDFGEVTFRIEEDQPEVIMAGDTFGAAQIGRAQQNGRFYSIRETDVPANTVFMPGYSTSPFFGVNEVPIPANKLGAYATTGIFCFDFPDGWTSVEGQAVYYKPTSATEGTFSATSSAGAVRIGFEVFQPNVAGKLCVYIQPGAGLES